MKQQRQTKDSEQHSDVLRYRLKPAIRRKRCGLLFPGKCLWRDNVKYIHKLKLELLPVRHMHKIVYPARFTSFDPNKMWASLIHIG
jgi:hypothetical protein